MVTQNFDSVHLEREKIELEREKLKVERQKTQWAAVGSIIPIVVALGTIVYGIWSLRATAQSQFETKVAELALAAPDPDAAKARAQILAVWFQDSLPKDMNARLESFKPEDFGNPDADSKKELFKAIAEHPDKRNELIETWKALFPDDSWIESLDALSDLKKPNRQPLREGHSH